MAFKYTNFWEATLQQAILAASTTAYIESALELLIPTLTGGDVMRVVLEDDAQAPEIIDITAHSAGSITIERAKENTAARDWPQGTRVTCALTATVVEQLAAAGAIARFTGTATGTNAYTVTAGAGATVPVPSAGDEVFFQIPNENTGAATLDYTNGSESVGVLAIVHEDGEPLEEGDLQAGWWASVRYHAGFSKWVLVSQSSNNLHAEQINDGPIPTVNLIPNGNFLRWTDGTSFSTPASGTQVADGYYVEYDGTIGAFTVSRQDFTLGQTDVLGEPKHFLRWNHTSAGSGSSYRRLRTKLPGGVGRLGGRKAIRSVWLKADSARTVPGKIIQHFGSGGSPSADVEAESVAFSVTTSWQRFTIPDTLPSISGKTLGSGGDDGLILSLDLPVNTTMTIDVAMDQLEPGHIASLPAARLPWDTREGGTGRVYANFASLASALFASVWTSYPDLADIETVTGTGLLARIADNDWALRNLAAGTGLSVSNPAGVAGNPTVSLASVLAAYHGGGTPSANGLSLVTAANYAAMKALLDLEIGTDVQAYDADTAKLDVAQTWTANQIIGSGTQTPHSFGDELTLRNESSAGGLSILSGNASIGYVFFGDTDSNTVGRIGYDHSTNVMTLGVGGDSSVVTVSTSAMGFQGNDVLTTATGAVLSGGNTFSGNQVISDTTPDLRFHETDAGTDEKGWRFQLVSGQFRLRTANDAGSSASTPLAFSRTGTTPTIAEFDICDLRIEPNPASIATNSAGFLGIPGNAANTSSFTLALSDAGKYRSIAMSSASQTVTIPPNSSVAFPIGTVVTLRGAASGNTFTIIEGSGVTLMRGDGIAGSGTRTVTTGAERVVVLWKIDTNTWLITGAFT